MRERLAARPAFGMSSIWHTKYSGWSLHVAYERRAQRHPDRMAVVVEVALLELAARASRRTRSRPSLLATLLRGRRDGVRSSIDDVEQLAIAPPEDLHQRAIHAEERAVDEHQRHADRRVLERAAEPLLRLAQLGFGAVDGRSASRALMTMPSTGRLVEQVGGDGFDHAPRAVGMLQRAPRPDRPPCHRRSIWNP